MKRYIESRTADAHEKNDDRGMELKYLSRVYNAAMYPGNEGVPLRDLGKHEVLRTV